MVVKLVDGMCVLMPDSRQGELKVFAKDLTEATESGTGVPEYPALLPAVCSDGLIWVTHQHSLCNYPCSQSTPPTNGVM